MVSGDCDRRAAHLPELHNVRVFELLVVYDLPLYVLRDLVPRRQRQHAVCARLATEQQREQRFQTRLSQGAYLLASGHKLHASKSHHLVQTVLR